MCQFFGDAFEAAVLQPGCYIQEFGSGVAAIFLFRTIFTVSQIL